MSNLGQSECVCPSMLCLSGMQMDEASEIPDPSPGNKDDDANNQPAVKL